MVLRKLWNLLNLLSAYFIVGAVAYFALYGIPDLHSGWPFVFLALWPLILLGKIVVEMLLLGALVVVLLYLWEND